MCGSSVVYNGEPGAFPVILNSRSTVKALHHKLSKVIKSKNSTLRKSKSLFFRVPFHVSQLSAISHDSELPYFEIISNVGESLVVSSSNKKLLLQAKCGLINSTKIISHSVSAIKTPAQMAREAGW
ncbi:hypothetical protein LLG10_06320 [bacterium]|nr:hypothetical protein [bacterium]